MPTSVLSLVDGLIQQTAGIATESDLASALAELTPGITAPLYVLGDCDYAPNGYSRVNGTNLPYTQNTPSIMDGILYQFTSNGLGTNNGPQFAFQILYAKYNNGEIIASLPYYRQATWQTTGMVWTEWDHAIDWADAATTFAPIAGDTQNTFEVAPATAGNQAPQWQQVQAAIATLTNNFAGIFAPIAGSAAQTFSVAQATSDAQAPSWGQVQAAIAAADDGASAAWAQGQFAPLAGNAEQAFAVAPGTGTQAAQMQQVQSAVTAAVSGLASQNWAQGQFAPLAGNAGQAFAVAPGAGAQAAQMQQVTALIAPYNFLLNGLAQPAPQISDCNLAPMGYSVAHVVYGNVVNGPAGSFNGFLYTASNQGSLTEETPPGNWVTQYYYDPNVSAVPFLRNKINDAGWSAWVQLASESWAQGQFFPLTGGIINGGISATLLQLRSSDGKNSSVAYSDDGTLNDGNDFVIRTGGPTTFYFTVFTGNGQVLLPQYATNASSAVPLGQAESLFQPIKAQYQVANLPTGVAAGTEAQVTDASNPVWHQTLVGGGSTLCNALYNGTNWVAT